MDANTISPIGEHEPATLWTPRDALMEEEDLASRARTRRADERDGDWWAEAFAGVNEGLNWCFCGGANPAEVLWRFWRLARALRCPEVRDYTPLAEPLFWKQDRSGGLHRLRIIFPEGDVSEVDLRIRQTLARGLALARRRSRWAPPHAVERLEDFPAEALWSMSGRESLRRVFGYLFLKGTDPGRLLRRLYAFTKWLRPELVLDMSLADLGAIFGGETRAVQSWRVQQVMNGLLDQMGTRGRASWQRSDETRLRCREGQLRRKRLRRSRRDPAVRGGGTE